jgi:hypothetical protein
MRTQPHYSVTGSFARISPFVRHYNKPVTITAP